MKTNNLLKALTAILAVTALLTAWFVITYAVSLRKLHRVQPKAAFYNNKDILMQAFAKEMLDYSSRHPDVKPILQSVGLDQTAPPSPKPAVK